MEKTLDYLNRLQGLPAIGLVFLGCIVFGYCWRFLKFRWFPNDAIPVAVILAGALFMILLADPVVAGGHARIWVMRNLLVGAITGFAAWLSHALVLKRIEDKIQSLLPTPPAP